jgi:hypothetical protein
MWTRACSRWPGRTIVEFAPRRKGCCGATTTTATPSGGAFQLFEIRSRLLDGIPHYYSPLWCHVRELLESHHHRPCIIIIIKSNPPNFYFFSFSAFLDHHLIHAQQHFRIPPLSLWPFSFFSNGFLP